MGRQVESRGQSSVENGKRRHLRVFREGIRSEAEDARPERDQAPRSHRGQGGGDSS